jgi:hypothetical protein
VVGAPPPPPSASTSSHGTGRPGAPAALHPLPPPVTHLPGTGANRTGSNHHHRRRIFPFHGDCLSSRDFPSFWEGHWSPLIARYLQELPTSTAGHRRSLTVVKRRCVCPLFSALVDPSPRWARIDFSLPGALPVTPLSSRRPPCRPQAWWPRLACVCATPWRPGWLGHFGSWIGLARPGPRGLLACWPARATSPWSQGLGTVPSFFYYLNLFSDLNIHRNSVILLEYIENGLSLRKMWNKICWSPL